LKTIAQLSNEKDGPLLAQAFLKKHGIVMVVVRHLSKTKVDGVAILEDKTRPIIGLSLRFDRLDNFWFTLLHELSHVALHLNQDNGLVFFDELEDGRDIEVDEKEKEADALTEEAIVPKSKWSISPARATPSSMAAQSLATELGVHIAVIAGFVRHKHQNYFYLTKIVNNGDAKVRHYFPKEFSQ
jgi:HTH-type transcriptional regulator/antitoxin HigA